MASSLSIDVFNSGYKPIPGGPGWDDSTPATWPASTSTLISGDRNAVLVDALPTTSEGERLAAWVQNTGKRPHAIFVTHGHGDHFFGAGPVLDAFPDAQLMACDQQVVDEARGQTGPEAMAIWNSWFTGQFSQSPVVPALTSSQEFDLEGHPLLFRTIGGADGALATIVHVPDLQTICSGDIVYNNIHMWLWNSTSCSRSTPPTATGTPCSPRHPPSSPPNHGPRQAHRNCKHHVLPTAHNLPRETPRAAPEPSSTPTISNHHKSADPHCRRFPLNTTDQRHPALLREAFAADLPAETTALMAATQRPAAAAAFTDASGPPAWRKLPSWAVVATGDKAAGADVARSMARRAGADIVEVEGLHVIMISQPQAVTDHILKAAQAVAGSHP